jgi:hypothetical protein
MEALADRDPPDGDCQRPPIGWPGTGRCGLPSRQATAAWPGLPAWPAVPARRGRGGPGASVGHSAPVPAGQRQAPARPRLASEETREGPRIVGGKRAESGSLAGLR